MKHTKAEKQAYFKALRANWQAAKKQLENGQLEAVQAIIKTHGLNISGTGFMFVSMQMKTQGLDGLPYLDAKTYNGWIDNGFRVRKGEKSTLSGITWLQIDSKKTDDDKPKKNRPMIPKEYHLFHRSQVDAI